jgi:hypothetical protein
MFQAEKFPCSVSSLATSLSKVNADDFSHCGEGFRHKL